MNFLEAAKALKEGKCEAIRDCKAKLYRFNVHGTFVRFYYNEPGVECDAWLGGDEILGEWELVDPVITPKAGEVWNLYGTIYFIYDYPDGLLRYVSESGRIEIIGKANQSAIQHGKDGWRLVWSPHREVPKEE